MIGDMMELDFRELIERCGSIIDEFSLYGISWIKDDKMYDYMGVLYWLDLVWLKLLKVIFL